MIEIDQLAKNHPTRGKQSRESRCAAMDLETALKPMRIISNILGLGLEGRLGRAYACLVFLCIATILYGSSNYLTSGEIYVVSEVDSFVLWTQYIANASLVLVVTGVALLRPGRYLIPNKEFRAIDEKLRYFGVRVINSPLRRIQILQIIVTIIITIAFGMDEFRKMIKQKSINLVFYWLHYGYAVTASIVVDHLFVDYLAVIKIRFCKINHLITKLGQGFQEGTMQLNFLYVAGRDESRKTGDSTVWKVVKLRLLHQELWCVARKINDAFGLQELVSTTISLVIITGQIYEIYRFVLMDKMKREEVAYKLILNLFYAGRLLYVSTACVAASNEAKITASVLHKVPIHGKSKPFVAEMQQFSLQLLHEDLNFNACGFFNLDFVLVGSIAGTVTTYFVILIQMDEK